MAVESLIARNAEGWRADAIRDFLNEARLYRSSGLVWTSWDIDRFLIRRGIIPAEHWEAAEWDNRQFDARLEREAWDRAEARRKEELRIGRGHEALGRAGRRLDRAIVRFLRRQAQGVGRWSERLRETKVAARRRTLTSDQVDADLAKAARARAALRERGDRFLQAVGPLILAMRRHHLTFPEIARHLEQAGIATAKGGPWTAAAANSVAERLRGRQLDPSFALATVDWTPTPPVPPSPPATVPLLAEPTPSSIEPEPIAPPIALAVAVVAPRPSPPAPPRAPAGPGSREAARRAEDVRDRVWPLVKLLRDQGLSLDRIASRLNDAGMLTVTDKRWAKAALSALIGRMEQER